MRKALLLSVLALVLLLAGCGTSDNGGTVSAPKATSTTSTTSAGGSGAASGGTVSISIKDFAFSPRKVAARSGPLTIDVSNDDVATHTFTIDALKINERLDPGKKATIQVNLPSSGTVQWHCNIHSSMTGEFDIS